MHEGEIIVFRHRGDVHIGRLQSADIKKIKATTGGNRVVEMPAARVLYETGLDAKDDQTLDQFRRSVEEKAEELDLQDVWDVLKEEETGYSFQDIAELYWGEGATTEQYGATLVHLARGCPYFLEQNAMFTPLSDERVEANLTRITRQQASREDRTVFLEWIQSDATSVPEDFSNRQRHWLERIQQYAMLGDEYDQSAQARELLEEIKGDSGGDLQRYAFNLMVRKKIWDEDEHLDLMIHHIPVEFDENALQQIATLSYDIGNREDLTALSIFSVDDANTMDIDDALSMEETEAGYRIGVHIADASLWIPRNTPLDFNARQRTTSLYFPDRHIPMLPPELSYDRCSLLPGQQRYAVSYLYEVNRSFELLDTVIVPSVIVNQAKLSYQDVDRILQMDDHPLSDTLRVLNEAVDVFYAQRIEQGAVELERTELNIEVDATKHIRITTRTGQSRAEHIVSELMIMTNVAAAHYLMENDLPSIYRTQAEPELKGIDEATHDAVRRFLVLRQLKPLELSVEPKPHAMLGVDAYCQMTSPIRRYIDLVLQRQLTSYIRTGQPCYTQDELLDEISHIEGHREIQRIAMRRGWYWLLKYLNMLNRPTLKAVVLDVRERDMMVELLEYGSRVTVKLAGQVSVGDEISVRVSQADAWKGDLLLAHIADEKSGG